MKRLLFVLAAAAALASCPEPKPVPVTEIQLNHTGIVLKDSASAETLKAVVLPAEADSAVRWSVSPEGVVTLTDNGDGSCTVKPAQGVTEGEATVTVFSAAYPSVKQTCIVTVFAGGTLTNTDLIKAVENERTMNWSKDENGCVPLTTANLEEIRRVTYLYISWSKYSATEEDVRLTDLSGIEHFTGLTSLTLYGHQITKMPDLAPLENLRTFGLNSNETSDGVRSLPEGFFSKLPPSVTSLSVSYDGLTSLDVSLLTKLTSLDCSSNELTSLDVSLLTKLTSLDCSSNELTSLDVSSLTDLTSLSCYSNKLTSLDVSSLTDLTSLSCYSNKLTSLDVSSLTNLKTLRCSSNKLTSLGTLPSGLTSLTCSYNDLTSLDVSSLTKLTDLDCGSNYGLTDLKFPSGLITLDVLGNGLTTLNVSSLTNLKTLRCSSNKLTSLGTLPSGLTSLTCSYNDLTSLDVSSLTNLRTLSCYDNQMSALDVSKCSALETLQCGRQSNGNSVDRQLTLTVSADQKMKYWDTGEWAPDESDILNYNENVVLADEAAETGGSV